MEIAFKLRYKLSNKNIGNLCIGMINIWLALWVNTSCGQPYSRRTVLYLPFENSFYGRKNTSELRAATGAQIVLPHTSNLRLYQNVMELHFFWQQQSKQDIEKE